MNGALQPPRQALHPALWLVAGGVLLLVLGFTALWVWTPLGGRLSAPRQAPDFEMESLDGRILRLADYRGQVVLLNFWSTTCPPCREELPEIERLHRDYAQDGLAVVAVSAIGSPATVREYVNQRRFSFAIALDDGRDVSRRYRVSAIPHTVLIDRAGMIRHKQVFPVRGDTCRDGFA